MTLGSTIKDLRLSAGLTQEVLAAKAGISTSFLSLLEGDKRDPTVRVLRNVGRALQIPPGLLIAAAVDEITGPVSDANSEASDLAREFTKLLRAAHHMVVSERLDGGYDVSPAKAEGATRRSAGKRSREK